MGISKERRQIEIPAFIPWNFMDAIGAVIDNDRIDDCVWIYVWKSGSNVPGLYFDGAVIIQLLFFCYQWCDEIHTRQCGND